MSKDEYRMPKECLMTKAQIPLVIRHSFVNSHWAFVIRYGRPILPHSHSTPSSTGAQGISLGSAVPLNRRRCSDWLNGVQAEVWLRSSWISRVKLCTLA